MFVSRGDSFLVPVVSCSSWFALSPERLCFVDGAGPNPLKVACGTGVAFLHEGAISYPTGPLTRKQLFPHPTNSSTSLIGHLGSSISNTFKHEQ